MKRMSLDEFSKVVARVMETLPEEFKPYLEHVTVEVHARPDRGILQAAGFTREEIDDGESLLGICISMDPFGLPGTWDPRDQPTKILLFQEPHEEMFPDPRQLRIEIRKTVIHELAHHFGYTEADLERFDNNPNPFPEEEQP